MSIKSYYGAILSRLVGYERIISICCALLYVQAQKKERNKVLSLLRNYVIMQEITRVGDLL